MEYRRRSTSNPLDDDTEYYIESPRYSYLYLIYNKLCCRSRKYINKI